VIVRQRRGHGTAVASENVPTLSELIPTITSPVKLIDLAAYYHGSDEDRADVLEAVRRSCEDVGFMVITGHGVAQDLIDAMYDASQAFYAQPQEVKLAARPETGDPFIGFAPIGSRVYRRDEQAPNLVEMFHINRFDTTDQARAAGLSAEAAEAQAPNIWPAGPSSFEPAWRAYYAAMEDLARRLAAVFAAALGLPEDALTSLLERHVSNLSANWYPPLEGPPEPGQVRARTHIDFSFFTILYQDDAPGGLEVRDHDGTWHPIPAIPGSYVVNLGDVMNRMTNDRWKATFHRVALPPEESYHRGRISIPYFVTPDYDAVIECVETCRPRNGEPQYPPVTAGAYAATKRTGRRGPTTV
jgi:isopenicillin N synthase-like dioxygenase